MSRPARRSWISRLFDRRPAAPLRRPRLGVEALEDRAVPAVTTLTNNTTLTVDGSSGNRTVTAPDLGTTAVRDVNVVISFTKVDTPGFLGILNGCTPGDIYYSLYSPVGAVSTNLIFAGTYTANPTGNVSASITFDQQAASALGSSPAGGTFRPVGNLDVFNRQYTAGTWTLVVGDSATPNQLIHTGFSLLIRTNDKPVANADAAAITAGTASVSGNVRTNDTDADGDTLSVQATTAAGVYGTLTLAANGAYTYTLNNSSAAVKALAQGQQATDAFTYTVSDGYVGGTATGTLTVTVTGVNETPTATADAYAVDEDTTLTVAAQGVLANDADPDSGTALTAALVSGPAHGSLTLNADGSFTYRPAADYNGPDSFTYRPWDGFASGNTVTVSLTVDAVNDAPVLSPDAAVTDQDVPVTLGVLANDTPGPANESSQTLTVTRLNGTAVAAGQSVATDHGSVRLNADGTVTYTPAAGYAGGDSFTYTAADNGIPSVAASTTGTVTVNATNAAPTPAADAYALNEDGVLVVPAAQGVLSNDTDPDGDGLTVADPRPETAPQYGSLELNADGSFTYTPFADFNGDDSFTYRASDGKGGSAVAAVTVRVAPVNDRPAIPQPAPVVREAGDGTPFLVPLGPVSAGPADEQGQRLDVQVRVDDPRLLPSVGVLAGPDGYSLVVSPTPGAIGTANVTVTATDDGDPAASASRTFAVTIRDTTAPTFTPPAYITVFATGPGGAVVDYQLPRPADGVDPNATIVASPPSGSVFPVGTTAVAVTATDASGNQSAGTFYVTVADGPPVTTAAAAGPAGLNGWYTGPVTLTLTATDAVTDVAATYFQVTSVGGKGGKGGGGGGGGSQPATGIGNTVQLSGDGVREVTYWSVDAAGNSEERRTITIPIDGTGPTVVPELTTADGSAYTPGTWTSQDVGVSIDLTDAVSGVGYKTGRTVLTADGVYPFAGAFADLAGNETPYAFEVRIDKTAPATTAAAAGPAGLAGWYTGPVTLTLTPADAGSGAAATYYRVDGGATQTGTAVGLSADGVYAVEFWSVDAVGNAEAANAVTVKIDGTAPDTAVTSGPAATTPATAAAFTFAGADDLSPAADLVFRYRLDGGAWQAGATASFAGLAGGPHALEVAAVDLAGNVDLSPAVYRWTVSTLASLTAADLRGMLDAGGGAVALTAGSEAEARAVLAAVAGLTGTGAVSLTLPAGGYGALAAAPPAGVALTITGQPGAAAAGTPTTPAVTIGGAGTVTLAGLTLNAGGAGPLLVNNNPNPVTLTGTAFQVDGAPLADPFAVADRVTDRLDGDGRGLVTWAGGRVYVTPNTARVPSGPNGIQRAIDAVQSAAGDLTVNVKALDMTAYTYVPYTLALGPAASSVTVQGWDAAGTTPLTSFGLRGLGGGAAELVVGGSALGDVLNVSTHANFPGMYTFAARTAGVQTPTGLVPASALGPDGRIVLSGGAGNDALSVGPAVTAEAVLWGGAGNDTLTGGGGNDLLFGEAGDDNLAGGLGDNVLAGGAGDDYLWTGLYKDAAAGFVRSGRNLMVGGDGLDRLYAGGNDDVLITGRTAHDADPAALRAVSAEWVRSSALNLPIADRVKLLSGETAGGTNGSYLLNRSTIRDDGVADQVWGNYNATVASGEDWVVAGTNDTILDFLTAGQLALDAVWII